DAVKINDTIKITILLLLSSFCHAQVMQIEPQQLLKQIQDQQSLTIVDVRSEAEYAQGHIAGAINIPYDQILKHKDKLSAYKNQNVILYCHSGRRAKIAAATLQAEGLTQLSDLNGHMILWQKLHYPLVK
ncbi:MAG TPA: rhodanese-like domain-containing protein, partial [Psychromonas sp.]